MAPTPIYLDNNATTRVDPRVLAAMLPYFTEVYGNAASRQHAFGQAAETAVATAREQVATLLNARPAEIVWTSGATESNNLALKGVAAAYRDRGRHIITTAVEHPAVLDPCRRLERAGGRLTVLPVDRDGRISAEQVADALSDETILVSVMAANNEIGTLQPLAAVGRLCKERAVLFHTDAVQAAGKVPLDVEALGIDLLSLSGHKMYGPKGVGALYVRRRDPRVRLEPLFDGGGHERGLRSGTVNVPGVVGLGAACEICRAELAEEAVRLTLLRDRLRAGIAAQLPDAVLNGHPTERLPSCLNLSFPYIHSDALMLALRSLAVSSGSACTSAEVEPSHVLRAIGLSDDLAHGSIRFGLGRFTTEAEIDFAVGEVVREVLRLRALSPEYQLAQSSQST
jgi:cysteine desulfurase